MSKTKYRPPTPIPPTPPKVERRRDWVTTTTNLVDNQSCVIVGVQATAARMSQETVAAQDMLTRFAQWQGGEPSSIAADASYGNGEFLQWLLDRGITPYMRTRDSARRKNNPGYGPERFTYLPESNSYRCPAAELKNLIGLRRLRLRRLRFVREQFFLAAAAQNIKRLVRFLSRPAMPALPATT